MIKIKKPDINKSVITEMEIEGQSFKIELLPLGQKEFVKHFSQFRKHRSVYNPVTKQMDYQTFFDDDDPKAQAITEDLLDQHVVNFWGISLDGKTELDGTKRENKLLLGEILVEDFEEIPIEDPVTKEKAVIKRPRTRRFSALIFDKCIELAKIRAEIETKN